MKDDNTGEPQKDDRFQFGTRYLREPEVLNRVGVSWVTLLRWQKSGLFPVRIRLGPNTVAWREDEVEEWCAKRTKVKNSGGNDV